MDRFDHHKAIAAMLYLASKKPDRVIGYYELVKLMYFADKKYFQKRGRTITSDEYARMDHGSTGSATYDLLKEALGKKTPHSALRAFVCRHLVVEGEYPNLFVRALVAPDLDDLSPMEIQTLDEVFQEDGGKTFDELKAKAHDAAWNAKKQDDDWWITYEELAEGDRSLIEYLRTRSDETPEMCAR